jgi:hypothetical protein
VVAGVDSEDTVLETGIFRAILEDAVDEAGSVVLLPTRRHRLGGVDLGSRAAAVAVARVDSARRATSHKVAVGGPKAIPNSRRLTADRAPVEVAADVARVDLARRVTSSRVLAPGGGDFTADGVDEAVLRQGWAAATEDLQGLC